MVGKWHLCPDDEMNLAADAAELAERARVRALVRLPRCRDQPVVSRPRLRQPHRSTSPRPGGGLPPHGGPDRQGDRVHPRRQGDRAGEAVLPLLRAGRVSRPAPRPEGMDRQVQGSLRHRLRGAAGADAGPAEGARHRPGGHRAAADQPDRHARDAHRPGRKAVPAARRHPPVGLADRRRAARCSPAWPRCTPDSSARRRPDRPAARTSSRSSGWRENTLVVLVSDNGASGEGGPNGSVNEMKFANGIPDTHGGTTFRSSTSSAAPRRTTTTRTAGRWPSTRRSRCGSATSSTAAPATRASSPGRQACRPGAKSASSTTTPSTSCPTILEVLGVEAPETIKGHVQSGFDGASMRYALDDASAPTTRRAQFYSMLGSRAIWHDGWKAVTNHPTIAGWSNFNERRVGALPYGRRPVRTAQRRRRAPREGP